MKFSIRDLLLETVIVALAVPKVDLGRMKTPQRLSRDSWPRCCPASELRSDGTVGVSMKPPPM